MLIEMSRGLPLGFSWGSRPAFKYHVVMMEEIDSPIYTVLAYLAGWGGKEITQRRQTWL